MEENQKTSVESSGEQFETTSKAVGKRQKKTVRSLKVHPASTMQQVTLSVERDVLAVFEDISQATGVNRQHLMREALRMYGALLQTGHRVYEVPNMVRRAS